MKNKNILKTLLITATSSSVVIPCATLASCTNEIEEKKPISGHTLDFSAKPKNINMDTSSVPLTIKSTGTYHMSWSLTKSKTDTTTQARLFWYRKWVNVEGEARWTKFMPWTKDTNLSFSENDVVQIVSGNPQATTETVGGKFSTSDSIFKIKLGTSDDTCKISLGGDISSLLMKVSESEGVYSPITSESPYENQYTDYNFQSLFEGSNNLFTVGANFLPYARTSIGCYAKMFKNCINLERAPILRGVQYKPSGATDPIEMLAPKAFESMFEGCSKLQTSPYLAARILGLDCYKNMFKGCSSLNSISMAYVGNFRQEFFSGWTTGVNLAGNIYYDGLDTEEKSTIYGIPQNFTVQSKNDYWKQENLVNIKFSEKEQGIITDTKTTFAMYKDISKQYLYDVDYVLPTHSAAKGSFFLLDAVGAKITTEGTVGELPEGAEGYRTIKISKTSPKFVIDYNATNVEVKETTLLKYNSKNHNASIQYRTFDSGTRQWSAWTNLANKGATLTAGSYVELQGNLDNTGYLDGEYTGIKFQGGEIILRGSLLPLTFSKSTIKAYGFCKLFADSTAIITIDEDEGQHKLLPTEDIGGYGMVYGYMFENCTNLQNCPSLPATTLGQACYFRMFNGCSSIKTAPELPATNLPEQWASGTTRRGVYQQMFMNCTSLVNAPLKLPAKNVKGLAYYEMFGGCSSLKKPPIIESTSETWLDINYQNLYGGYDSSPSSMSYMFYRSGIKVYNTKVTGAIKFYTCHMYDTEPYYYPPQDWKMFAETNGGYTENPQNDQTYYYVP